MANLTLMLNRAVAAYNKGQLMKLSNYANES